MFYLLNEGSYFTQIIAWNTTWIISRNCTPRRRSKFLFKFLFKRDPLNFFHPMSSES